MLKNKPKYHAIGLMSGSSLDGLDIAYCQFSFTNKWKYSLLKSKTASLGIWETKLKNTTQLNDKELSSLNIKFAEYLGQEIQSFIAEYHIKIIDLVVSHGHTIFHYPDKGITCQIGDGQTLANLLRKTVINNLRQKDIDAGGQGAPIVPIGDLHLFANYFICINIGGIANLSIKLKDEIVAFDICVANQILNHYANELGSSYDDKGILARNGKINTLLLEKLNELDFYKKNYPKSLDNSFKKELIILIDSAEKNIKNILATYTEHVAFQIKKSIKNFDLKNKKILITGGGVFNEFLIERIQFYLKTSAEIPSKDVINHKEAIVMAFIGVLRLQNEVNVLASVTGAKQDTICGDIFHYQT